MKPETGIALAALAVSLYSLWRQVRSAGGANLGADWLDQNTFVIFNHGPGAAKRLEVSYARNSEPAERAITYLGPGHQHVIRIGERALFEQPPRTIQVSWRDNRLSRQELALDLGDTPPGPRKFPEGPKGGIEGIVKSIAAAETQRQLAQVAKSVARSRRNR